MKKHPIQHKRAKDKRIKYISMAEKHFYLIENIVCVVFGIELICLKTIKSVKKKSLYDYARSALFHYSHSLLSPYGIRLQELSEWNNPHMTESNASRYNVRAKGLLINNDDFTSKYLEVVFELEKSKTPPRKGVKI